MTGKTAPGNRKVQMAKIEGVCEYVKVYDDAGYWKMIAVSECEGKYYSVYESYSIPDSGPEYDVPAHGESRMYLTDKEYSEYKEDFIRSANEVEW